jgi:hypothetical protein
MYKFKKIIEDVLNEDVVAGGSGSAFGSGTTSTETAFSGDNYAKGDARTPKALGGKVIRRNTPTNSTFKGCPKGKKKKKKKK